jgi:excisionase family DNA binding protein
VKSRDEIPTSRDLALVLTVREAAQKLACSEAHIRRLIDSGDLPAMRLGGGLRSPYRVPRKGLEDYVTSRLGREPLNPAPMRRESPNRAGSSAGWAFTYAVLPGGSSHRG